MFGTLIDSKPVSERSLRQALLSLLIHGGLLVGAVRATRGAAEEVRARLVDGAAVFIRPVEPKPPTAVDAKPSSATPSVTTGPSFQTITPPTGIPFGIPPVDLGESFDPSRFTGVGRESGAPGDLVPAAPEMTPRDYTQDEVDDPVRYLGGGDPVFPPALRDAGISGRVVMQFVVDTTGRVEPRSVRILTSSRYGFEQAARDAIGRARFEPARVRGHAVRQLVQQAVVFSVG